MIDKIEKIMKNDRETFCEFLTCFYNKGLAEILCDCKDNKNFWFRRVNKDFGINDMFIYSEDKDYFDKVISVFDGSVVTALTPFEVGSEIQNNRKISVRRQFCKSEANGNFNEAVKLDASHKPLIDKSVSDTTRDNFSVAIEFGEACFGLFEDELYCFASVSEIKKAGMAEINWIHTEPAHRNRGYAATLLQSVSDKYINNGYLVTYHCDNNNLASANTALKCGFKEVAAEIILEKQPSP